MAEKTETLPELKSKLQRFSTHGKLSDLQTVLASLKHPVDEIKILATKAATNIIRENLLANYTKMEKEVRKKLAVLLETLDPSVIDEISKDLFSETAERRLNAVQILGLLKKNPRIKDILINLVKDRDVKVRATAVLLLGKTIGPHDFEIILALLNDNDNRVRANTIEALEAVGNKRLVPILLRFRKDGNNRIRGNILKALYSLGYLEIEPDLFEMLNTSNDLMIASALWVIAQVKLSNSRIEDAIAKHLLSDSEMVVRNARNSLAVLSTPRALGYLKYLTFEIARVPLV